MTWRENQALAQRLHAAKLKGACVEEIDYVSFADSLCTLAQKACRDGYSALRAVRTIPRSEIARADGSLPVSFVRLSRIDVPVINDWAVGPAALWLARK